MDVVCNPHPAGGTAHETAASSSQAPVPGAFVSGLPPYFSHAGVMEASPEVSARPGVAAVEDTAPGFGFVVCDVVCGRFGRRAVRDRAQRVRGVPEQTPAAGANGTGVPKGPEPFAAAGSAGLRSRPAASVGTVFGWTAVLRGIYSDRLRRLAGRVSTHDRVGAAAGSFE